MMYAPQHTKTTVHNAPNQTWTVIQNLFTCRRSSARSFSRRSIVAVISRLFISDVNAST